MKSYKVVVHCDGTFEGQPCDMALEATGTLKQAEDEVARGMYSGGWETRARFQKPHAHYCPACAGMLTN